MRAAVRLFNEKLLAPRGVTLLPHHPRTLEYYLWEAPTSSVRLQRYEPLVEAASTEWRAFAVAWNAIVDALRRNDYLSNGERDELTFELLTGETLLHFGASDGLWMVGLRDQRMHQLACEATLPRG